INPSVETDGNSREVPLKGLFTYCRQIYLTVSFNSSLCSVIDVSFRAFSPNTELYSFVFRQATA
ncbi:MAG: hypothetical protein LBN27_03885, partial [Prevotellaceae bacterium]|nr:hypothetical protein [Prevotellaceae bacterium]